MAVTLADMPVSKKTIQVRIPIELGSDVSLVAAALGKSVPEWVAEVLRSAVNHNMPRVKKIVDERAAKGGKG